MRNDFLSYGRDDRSKAMRFTYAELWFLQLCIDNRITGSELSLLPVSEENQKLGCHGFFNCATHGLSIPEIGEVLFRLFQRGAVEFKYYGKPQEKLYEPKSGKELKRIIDEERDRNAESPSRCGDHHDYELTPLGVFQWERYAKPNWSKYIDGIYSIWSECGNEIWYATSMSEYRTRTSLALKAQHPDRPFLIDWNSAKIKYQTPWVVFPGKPLRRGVEITVSVTPQESRCCYRSAGSTLFNYSKWAKYGKKYEKHFRWYEHGIENHPDRPQMIK